VQYDKHEKEFDNAENRSNSRAKSCYFVHDGDSDDQLLDDHASDTVWKQRYMNLRRHIRRRDSAIGKYKRKILEAVMADIWYKTVIYLAHDLSSSGHSTLSRVDLEGHIPNSYQPPVYL